MAMEALSSSNELFNFVIYDTISATPCSSGLISNAQDSSLSLDTNPNHTTDLFLNDNNLINHDQVVLFDHHHHHHHHYHQLFQTDGRDSATIASHEEEPAHVGNRRSNTNNTLGVEPSSSVGNIIKKKRKRKARVCKNKDEAETQRMTHIAVERNRRKQMNEHLAVLRSIMPDSYVQRGDQASIVGGAIEFVKELEHLLQSLEAQKLKLNLEATNTNNIEGCGNNNNNNTNNNSNNQDNNNIMEDSKFLAPPFSQFFVFPQYTWSQASKKYTSKTAAAIADIEVTLIETHASLRILSRRSLRQLSKLVAGFHSLHLTVLHLNVTTMSPLVLYSVSVKVEEECLLSSVDDIAAAVHHMLRIIEEEAAALC